MSDSDYMGIDRRSGEPAEWRAHVDKRLDDGAATMKTLGLSLAENTLATKAVHDNTIELVGLLQSFKGAFYLLEMMGKVAKPLIYIVAFCSATWGFITLIKFGGGPPK